MSTPNERRRYPRFAHPYRTRDLPSDYESFKTEIRSDQSEDDRGVYEVWWLANGRYPDRPLSARLAIAESAVSDLLREGVVELVEGEWLGEIDEREAVPDPWAVLMEWSTWVPQPNTPVVWMADTDRHIGNATT